MITTLEFVTLKFPDLLRLSRIILEICICLSSSPSNCAITIWKVFFSDLITSSIAMLVTNIAGWAFSVLVKIFSGPSNIIFVKGYS